MALAWPSLSRSGDCGVSTNLPAAAYRAVAPLDSTAPWPRVGRPRELGRGGEATIVICVGTIMAPHVGRRRVQQDEQADAAEQHDRGCSRCPPRSREVAGCQRKVYAAKPPVCGSCRQRANVSIRYRPGPDGLWIDGAHKRGLRGHPGAARAPRRISKRDFRRLRRYLADERGGPQRASTSAQVAGLAVSSSRVGRRVATQCPSLPGWPAVAFGRAGRRCALW